MFIAFDPYNNIIRNKPNCIWGKISWRIKLYSRRNKNFLRALFLLHRLSLLRLLSLPYFLFRPLSSTVFLIGYFRGLISTGCLNKSTCVKELKYSFKWANWSQINICAETIVCWHMADVRVISTAVIVWLSCISAQLSALRHSEMRTLSYTP